MRNSPEAVILTYAKGGLGKSTLGAQLAAWVYKKYKKITRVVNADGGGTYQAHAPLIEAGVSQLWNVDQWDEASTFYTLDKATQGWWPEDPNEPNSPLVAPYKSWKECPTCKEDVGAKGFALPKNCKSCKTPLAAGTFCRTKYEVTPEFDKVGAVIFEGFTKFGDMLLQRLRSVNSEGGRTFSDAGFKVSAPGKQHYGDAQTYLSQFVSNSQKIPVNVIYWTALEHRGEDEDKPVYGPKGPGKALTSTCIPWFHHVLHLDAVPKMEGPRVKKDENGLEVVERKLFLAPHYPPDNKLYCYTAKTSIPLAGKMETIMDFPADGNTAAKFMDGLAAARQRAKEALLG